MPLSHNNSIKHRNNATKLFTIFIIIYYKQFFFLLRGCVSSAWNLSSNISTTKKNALTLCARMHREHTMNMRICSKFYGKWMAKVHAESQNIHKCMHTNTFSNVCTFFVDSLFLFVCPSHGIRFKLGMYLNFCVCVCFSNLSMLSVCIVSGGLHWNYDGLYAFCHLSAVTLYYRHCTIVNDELEPFLSKCQWTSKKKKN